jgi:hypothetical protein
VADGTEFYSKFFTFKTLAHKDNLEKKKLGKYGNLNGSIYLIAIILGFGLKRASVNRRV